MNARVGIELTPTHVRAVAYGRLGKVPRLTLELPWDPSRPRDVVTVLGERLGPSSVALAIGLGFLHVKQIKLPPAPQVDRERMLALEPDRYFAAPDESLTTTLSGDDNIAFAVPTLLLTSIVEAFEEWADVERVEPSPVAIARALGGLENAASGKAIQGRRSRHTQARQQGTADGTFTVEVIDGETGLLEIVDGRLTSVRRITSPLEGVPAARPLPALGDLAPQYLAAAGAARGIDLGPDGMIVTPELRNRIRARRTRRTSLAAAACAASLIFAGWSFDRSREQRLESLRAEIAEAERAAAPALQADARLQALTREASTIRALAASRPDPAAMLAAIGDALPEGATVLNLRATGDEWQIDGTARNAAELVPRLDTDGRFDGVRFLAASSRFREGNRSYETFSIALRVKPKA